MFSSIPLRYLSSLSTSWLAIEGLHCSPSNWQFRAALRSTMFLFYSLASQILWKKHRQDGKYQYQMGNRSNQERRHSPSRTTSPSVSVEEPEPYIASATPEPERDNELPVILDPIIPTSAALEPLVFNEPSANTDPIQAPVEFKLPPAPAEEPDPIPRVVEPPSGQDEQNVNNPTIYVSPPPVPAVRVEQPVAVSVEQHNQQPEPSFGHWSSTLSEIKQKIEPLASATLQRLPRLDPSQVCVSWLTLVTHSYSFYFTTERTSRSCYPAPYFLALIHVPCLNFYCRPRVSQRLSRTPRRCVLLSHR
jgi:hypothetical protein